jgi:RloB-like protein
VDKLIDEAFASGVQVAFSHPCFELWLLLHFRDHGAPHGGSCGSVTDLPCACLPEYKKRGKRVSLGDIEGHYTAALFDLGAQMVAPGGRCARFWGGGTFS